MKKRGKSSKIVLFSGRFDPPNPGHVITILRLARIYGYVKVPILYQKGRRYPAQFAKQLFEEIFADRDDIEISINESHFAHVMPQDIKAYNPFHVYAANNIACLNNMENRGYDVFFTDRAYDYHSSFYNPIK